MQEMCKKVPESVWCLIYAKSYLWGVLATKKEARKYLECNFFHRHFLAFTTDLLNANGWNEVGCGWWTQAFPRLVVRAVKTVSLTTENSCKALESKSSLACHKEL